MTEHFAYTFRSDLTLEQVFERLNRVGPWKWYERDNDRWANFMFSMPVSSEDYRSDVKILADYDLNLYVVNVWFKSDQPDAQAQFETIRHTLFTSLLPAIGASELSKTDTYE